MLHWKAKVAFLAGLAALQHAVERDDEEWAEEAAEMLQTGQGRLLALDQALQTLCERAGIDAEAVRKVTEADPHTPLFDAEPDAEYRTEVEDVLCSAFDARE